MPEGIESGIAEAILPGGEGLVRTESGVHLVPNAVTGDRLEIRVEPRRRGASRGIIHRLLSASPERPSAPVCRAAEDCGGCALQYVVPAAQATIKNAWVSDAFAPHLGPDTVFAGISPSDVAWGARRRMRWHRGEDGKGTYWGFHGRASAQVVRHADCPVATPGIRALHASIKDPTWPGIESVQLTELADGLHLILEGVLEGRSEGSFVPELPKTAAGLPVQAWLREEEGCTPLRRPVRVLHDRLPAGDGWIDVAIGPDDFIQASQAGNEAMVRQVQAWCAGARHVADLFAGCGNLSLPLAASLKASVIGAEVNPASVAAANRSAKTLGLDARYLQADLFARFDVAPFAGMDVLIVDPPRKGAKRVCAQLATLLPRKIILISCDIASGARDAAAIAAHGYRLASLRALDMFPYAGHVEAMSLWER